MATSKAVTKKAAVSGTKQVAKTSSDKAPWERKSPKPKGHHSHLGPAAKAAAEQRAHAAGRTYPNLIDNMWAASKGKK